MRDDVTAYDHRQAVHFRDEAERLRNVIAAMLARHPDGVFVPDTAIEAKRGRDVAFTRHPQMAGYIVHMKPALGDRHGD